MHASYHRISHTLKRARMAYKKLFLGVSFLKAHFSWLTHQVQKTTAHAPLGAISKADGTFKKTPVKKMI
jgi:hypothetical protein